MFKSFTFFTGCFTGMRCFYITYTTTLSFVQMLVISIAIGIIGGLVLRICTDLFTFIKWTIKQRKS